VSFRLGRRGVIGGRVIGGMKLGFSATPQVSGRARDEPRECGLYVDCAGGFHTAAPVMKGGLRYEWWIWCIIAFKPPTFKCSRFFAWTWGKDILVRGC